MKNNGVFIDTSGYFAMLSSNDAAHERCISWLKDARKRKISFVTTDNVLSETATLLKARGTAHLAEKLFQSITKGSLTRLEFLNEERLEKVIKFYLKTKDQGYSFCDCASFVIMKELSLKNALTADEHFEIAGFTAILR